MNITEVKAVARKAGFARRNAAHDARSDESAKASAHMLSYIAKLDKKFVISAYMPIRSEIDVLPLMEKLHSLGHRICVPIIEGRGKPLSFREWTPSVEMVAGPFGAAVPAEGEWLSPDFLIVALVAFNADGYRIGYGGGYYDRSIEAARAKHPTLAVGFAYAAQEGEVPTERTDQRLDAMVTEKGVIHFQSTPA